MATPFIEVTDNGIFTSTEEEIRQRLIAEKEKIYNIKITQDPSNPDYASTIAESAVYVEMQNQFLTFANNCDPNTATGDALTKLCSNRGVIRDNGSYAKQNITIETDTTVTLYGLDNLTETTFVVADDDQKQYKLLETVTLEAGTATVEFRSAIVGYQQILPDTIKTAVVAIPGVVSINNSEPENIDYERGSNAESDVELRKRYRDSVSKSFGGVPDLKGQLLALDNVDACKILNNTTNQPVAYNNGSKVLDPHSVWVILDETTDENIGKVMYQNKGDSGASGMLGDKIVTYQENQFKYSSAVRDDFYVHLQVKDDLAYDTENLKNYIIANYRKDISIEQNASDFIVLAKDFFEINFPTREINIDCDLSVDGTNYAQVLTYNISYPYSESILVADAVDRILKLPIDNIIIS